MPTYTYTCTSCNDTLETRQSFTDPRLTTCDNCGGALRKVIHPVGIVFKGSGWYSTDSRASSSAKSGSAVGANGSDSPGAKDAGSKDSSSSNESGATGDGPKDSSATKDSGSKDGGAKDSGSSKDSGSKESAGSGTASTSKPKSGGPRGSDKT